MKLLVQPLKQPVGTREPCLSLSTSHLDPTVFGADNPHTSTCIIQLDKRWPRFGGRVRVAVSVETAAYLDHLGLHNAQGQRGGLGSSWLKARHCWHPAARRRRYVDARKRRRRTTRARRMSLPNRVCWGARNGSLCCTMVVSGIPTPDIREDAPTMAVQS